MPLTGEWCPRPGFQAAEIAAASQRRRGAAMARTVAFAPATLILNGLLLSGALARQTLVDVPEAPWLPDQHGLDAALGSDAPPSLARLQLGWQ